MRHFLFTIAFAFLTGLPGRAQEGLPTAAEADELYRRADELLGAYLYEDGVELLTPVLEGPFGETEASRDLWALLALLHYNGGDSVSGALRASRRARELGFDNHHNDFVAAASLSLLDRFEEARETLAIGLEGFERYLELNPEGESEENLAWLRVNLGKLLLFDYEARLADDPECLALIDRQVRFDRPFHDAAPLLDLRGEGPAQWFGTAVVALGDLDQDGVPDLAVAAPVLPSETAGRGRVHVFSGASGGTLRVIEGEEGEHLGSSLHSAGDVDADGRTDLAVGGAPGNQGRPLLGLRSASTGEELGPLFGLQSSAHFAISALPIQGAAGAPRLIVGSPEDRRGFVFDFPCVADPETGRRVPRVLWRGAFGDGSALALLASPDGPLLAIGSDPESSEVRGAVRLIALDAASSAAEPVSTFEGPRAPFRSTQIVGLGDLDGDGWEDYATNDVGERFARLSTDRDEAPETAVHVVSGRSGERLRTDGPFTTKESFGYSLAAVGDLDADGARDYLAGAPHFREDGIEGGAVYAVSGASGRVLRRWTGRCHGDLFGLNVAVIGDVDGDGRGDFAFGAPQSFANGSFAGRVVVVSGRLE